MTSVAVRLLNATSTGERLTFEDPAIDLARLDRMPAVLRWAFQQSATKLATKAFEAHLDWAMRKSGSPTATVRKLAEIEGNEIAVFAGEYRGRYGAQLPHVAADASIQRYGAMGPSRHPPKRYGKPVIPSKQRGRRRRRLHAMVG